MVSTATRILKERGLIILSAATLIIMTACASVGGASPSERAAESTDVSPSPSEAPHAAPPELRGAWKTTLDNSAQELVTLTFSQTGYQLDREQLVFGVIAVDANQITFSQSNLCDGVGTYTWSLDAGSLQFASVVPDECPGRAQAIDGQTYTH